jgi:putative long chain acyl-CoA synthase
VTERFPTARVLEFYASAEGEAILANVAGRVTGSMGRPLPGSAEVRVARCDLSGRRLVLADDGFARETDVDEIGLLLVRVHPHDSQPADAMRGVFEPGDAWRSSGDLFLRDEHGDHWLAGSVAEIIDTAEGPVLPAGARYMMGTLPCIDLVVGYGVREGDEQVLVIAATLCEGTELPVADLDAAMDKLPGPARPRYVQIVPSIPVTTWHRPQWRPLQAEGVPRPGPDRTVWRLGADGAHYEPVT